VEIPAVEGRTWLGPHLQDRLDRFLHLPDADRRRRREFPAVLLVFVLEKAGTDAERQSSPADQIDARRDFGEMRGIAITDRHSQATAPSPSPPRMPGPDPDRQATTSCECRTALLTSRSHSVPGFLGHAAAEVSRGPCFADSGPPRLASSRLPGTRGRASSARSGALAATAS
jgi:hypothetical protein